MKFISKLKAIRKILISDEFFLMTANDNLLYNIYEYKYYTNTKREMFFIYLKEFAKTLDFKNDYGGIH